MLCKSELPVKMIRRDPQISLHIAQLYVFKL